MKGHLRFMVKGSGLRVKNWLRVHGDFWLTVHCSW